MKKIFCLFICLSCFCTIPARADGDGSIASLNIPADPEILVMGHTRNNIASVALSDKKFDGGLSYTSWNVYSDIRQLPALSLQLHSGKWGFSLQAKSFVSSAFALMDEEGKENGSFRPYDAAMSFGAAYRIGFGFAFGVNVKGIYSTIYPEYKAAAVAGDLYLSWQSKFLTATAGLDNLGTPVRYAEGAKADALPMHARIGVDLRPVKGLHIAAESDCLLNNGGLSLQAAAQYTILGVATFRAGYHYSLDEKAALPSYASAGVAVNLFGVHLSGTYLFGSEALSNSFSIGIGYSF